MARVREVEVAARVSICARARDVEGVAAPGRHAAAFSCPSATTRGVELVTETGCKGHRWSTDRGISTLNKFQTSLFQSKVATSNL
jgi:hypothetical protein